MPLIFRTHRCQDIFSIRQMVIKTLWAQPYIINVTGLQSYINPYRSLLQRRTAGVCSLFINTLGNKTRRKTASQGDIKCNFRQTIWLTKYFFSCLITYVSNTFWHFCWVLLSSPSLLHTQRNTLGAILGYKPSSLVRCRFLERSHALTCPVTIISLNFSQNRVRLNFLRQTPTRATAAVSAVKA